MASTKKNKTKRSEMPRKTQSSRAGITFPVARVRRHLKKGLYANRIAVGGAIYLASVLEYLVAELMELAGNIAAQHKRNRISPRFISLAVKGDEEFDKLLSGITISQGGVVPYIQPFLRPISKKKVKED